MPSQAARAGLIIYAVGFVLVVLGGPVLCSNCSNQSAIFSSMVGGLLVVIGFATMLVGAGRSHSFKWGFGAMFALLLYVGYQVTLGHQH